MPIESRTVARQANIEKPTTKTPRGIIQKPRTSSQEEFARPEKTHAKMGSMFSKIAKHISLKSFTARDSAGTQVPMKSNDDLMNPDLDEIPARPGSISRLKHATSDDVEYQSSLLWPYASSLTHCDAPESEHPLRLRRPALYEEYWAHEPRTVSSRKH